VKIIESPQMKHKNQSRIRRNGF